MNKYQTKVNVWLTGALIAVFSSACLARFDNTPPSKGAYETGIYRNLAREMSIQDAWKRVHDGYNKMFSNNSTQQLYYSYSEDGNYQGHYIKTTDTNDIRTEGQSWGMTIAVMMNKQTDFDNLWRFAKKYQKNSTNHQDPYKQGVYAWQLKFNSKGKVYKADEGPAPDGEEYFAFALLNADARWGSNGRINYYQEALTMLNTIKNKLMKNKVIVFSPYVDNVTDPSYHLPAFYDYFADRVTKKTDKDYWSSVADRSRKFLKDHFAIVGGDPHWNLPTYLARPWGTPVYGNIFVGQNNPGDWYELDAWRVAMNVAMDAHIMGAEAWHKNAINGILGALSYNKAVNGEGCYKQKYGYGVAESRYCAGEGQKAANAVALLASTNVEQAQEFFYDFWNTPQPTGKYRYYNGTLYMLSMLHVTGKFKFYK
ncbi:glycosyl hydrolase family 8 [Vibrio hippocampi]|uniref:cellulase n=1 Tax=Vibrio hippocampi TaxID=654686 RepID=A0ABN8DJ66_9VIBR|nr:glycosyl hydrolase family 8 [Vibrio hippocampi]CAH0528851.1 Reducing end xylose-releasing exo-oligoxylanase [Vibrio hippocampi]